MASEQGKSGASHELVLLRVVPVPRALIWKAWTEPEHLKKWFCPLPWKAVECEIDLRPGGIFRTLMRGPNGEEHATSGCYIEVVRPARLVWTLALEAGFRPAADPFLLFTAILTFEDEAGGTRYTARALHKDAADAMKHAEMGFEKGWGAALDQLVGIAGELKG
jgi:uncharacterized protein YndB with AHSA1/START domain